MKILVTGGTGMVGSSFLNKKDTNKYILIGSKDCNLLDPVDSIKIIKDIKPDAVIHLAAKVGGIKGNTDLIADFHRENILINTNVLHSCVENNISNVVSLLSTCIYPDTAAYPLTPDQMHLGEPHESNFGYAYAKRMIEVYSRAIQKQYGFSYKTAIPNNIYGINDNFHYEHSHVIPALIRKIYEGKKFNKEVNLWGDGSPLREFTFSNDISDILIWMIERYDSIEPLNIGNTKEYSISDVSKIICNKFKFDYNNIKWDTSKPMGQYRKPSCNKQLVDNNKNLCYTNIDDGIEKVCNWFLNQYPNIRGFLR
tara:strand:- start:2176 stop:3108 length:933 start_codon:yes stop_codon:yes gene_type:complete